MRYCCTAAAVCSVTTVACQWTHGGENVLHLWYRSRSHTHTHTTPLVIQVSFTYTHTQFHTCLFPLSLPPSLSLSLSVYSLFLSLPLSLSLSLSISLSLSLSGVSKFRVHMKESEHLSVSGPVDLVVSEDGITIHSIQTGNFLFHFHSLLSRSLYRTVFLGGEII